jgi:hypothetical protein
MNPNRYFLVMLQKCISIFAVKREGNMLVPKKWDIVYEKMISERANRN